VTVTISEFINAPRQAVFNLFADFENAAKNIASIEKMEFVEGDPTQPGEGLKWKETRTVFGKEATETMWIAEIRPPEMYRVKSDSYGTDYESTYTFTEAADGTEVTMTFGGKPVTTKAKLQSLFAWLFIPATRKMLRQDITELKRKLESGKVA